MLEFHYSLCVVGTIAKFKVVTVNSGAGPLAVSIDGPSRVAIMCIEDAEGYEFVYTPTVPGDYYISLKYCNITIAGCPFKAVVTGKNNLYPFLNKGFNFFNTVNAYYKHSII